MTCFRTLMFLLGALLIRPASVRADDLPGLTRRFIFEQAPFPSCHASTLAEATDGTLVAAWFGGTREGSPDVDIWSSRLEKGVWSPPRRIATGVQTATLRHPCWNPVLFQPSDGPLRLFYKVGPSPSLWWGEWKSSADGGLTWSTARRLPPGILGPIKNKPFEDATGAWLCPSSAEDYPNPPNWRVHVEITSDQGTTWSRVEVPLADAPFDAIQPSFLGVPAGSHLSLMGRTRAGRMFRADSTDGGRHWSPLSLTSLPNPNAGTDALTLRGGGHLLVHNPVEKGRTPLVVSYSASLDDWRTVAVLEDEPASEFSYPSILQDRRGAVHITYTWKRQRIRHAVLHPSVWKDSAKP